MLDFSVYVYTDLLMFSCTVQCNYVSKVSVVLFLRICKEFETIQEKALKIPETTEDMTEMIAYIGHAKTQRIEELKSRIRVSSSFHFYLQTRKLEKTKEKKNLNSYFLSGHTS